MKKLRLVAALFLAFAPSFLAAPAAANESEVLPTVIVTPGGDDSSYQIPVSDVVIFMDVPYQSVYATTNAVITFGNPDGTYWDYPMTPSISLGSTDWVVFPTWREDEHFIITVTDNVFQVDMSARPIWYQNVEEPSRLVLTGTINEDRTLQIDYYLENTDQYNLRFGVRTPTGEIVSLEDAGFEQSAVAPAEPGEILTPTEPTEPQPTPSPEPSPTPEPTPSPEPTPEPTPTPSPDSGGSPEPTPPQPEPTPEPQPQPWPQPEPSPEPAPPQPPTEEPSTPVEPETPEPGPSDNPEEPSSPEPEVTPEPVAPSPTPDPTPETPEPGPTVDPEPTPNPEPSVPPVTELIEDLSTVDPTTLSEAQVEQLIEAALETFETAEPGSPEYEAALDALLIAAQADDVVLDEAIAAIPLIGNVAGAAVEVFNAIGNAGADMSPQVREQSEKVVIAAVIVGQIAMTATAAATSAASAAARRP